MPLSIFELLHRCMQRRTFSSWIHNSTMMWYRRMITCSAKFVQCCLVDPGAEIAASELTWSTKKRHLETQQFTLTKAHDDFICLKSVSNPICILRSILRIGFDNTNLDEPTWQIWQTSGYIQLCQRKNWRSLAPCGHVVVPNLRCLRPTVIFFVPLWQWKFSGVFVISTKLDSLNPFQTRLIGTLPVLSHSNYIWRSWRPSRQSCQDSIPAPWVRPNHGKSPEDPVDGLWMLTYAYCAGWDSPMYSTTWGVWQWQRSILNIKSPLYILKMIEDGHHVLSYITSNVALPCLSYANGIWHPGGVLTRIQCTMTSCPTSWGERVRQDKSWRELVAPGTQRFGMFGMGPGIPMHYQWIQRIDDTWRILRKIISQSLRAPSKLLAFASFLQIEWTRCVLDLVFCKNND